MPNKAITMTRLRTIIRLYTQGVGLRTIAGVSGISRNTLKKYLRIYNSLELSFEELLSKSDTELCELFNISQRSADSPRKQLLDSLLPDIVKALGKKGMTSFKQWEKYISEHPDGYALTQFRYSIQRYKLINNPSMHIDHKAGDKMYVDYTGAKLLIYPPKEQPLEVEVFVAILGCSLLTYVEASYTQNKEDFIKACENALYYYGGTPQAIVPDNLKSAVTKASRYEPTLNSEFERFAEHYSIAVVPARVRKPKDKSHVENAVKLTYKDIFTELEALHCPDLNSLNAAIRSALERYNNQNLTRRSYSRRDHFEEIERDALGELNPIRYQIKRSAISTVDKYGYVRLREDVHYYSVPHAYIGKKLRLAYTREDVEIYDGYALIASHPRSRLEFKRTTNPEHLSPSHRAVAEFSPEKFLREAAAIHSDVEAYIRKILETKRYADQSTKICSGILNFARKVGGDRLAAACRMASSYGKYNYREIEDILSNNSELLDPVEDVAQTPEHDNIRGREYYK